MNNPKQAKCYDKGWRYYSAADTDVARTFQRIRKQMKEEAAKPANVKPIRAVRTK